jgi:protein-tyrosine phosphatase
VAHGSAARWRLDHAGAEAVAFIAEEAAKGRVYVHCKIGYSRSAAVVGAYLLASHEAATVEEAVAQLRKVRPSIIIRPEAMEALRTFERREIEVGGLFG